MRQIWKKISAALLAAVLLAGMTGAGQLSAYAGETPAQPPQSQAIGSEVPPAPPAPVPSELPGGETPPPASSLPAEGDAVSQQPESAPAGDSQAEEEPLEPQAEQGLEEWLLELVALAESDGAAAAAKLNEEADAERFGQGLKAVLDFYYGNPGEAEAPALAEAFAAFVAGVDGRAAEMLEEYALAAAERARAGELGYVPGEVIVLFEPGVAENQAEQVAQEHDASLANTLETATPGVDAVAEISLGQTVEAAVEELQADPAVQYVQPVYLYTYDAAPSPNDPYRSQMWQESKLDTLGAWELLQNAGLSGAGPVKVMVLDTAIMATHPDLQANLNKPGMMSFMNGSQSSTMPSTFDGSVAGDVSHGTHVSGIIAATANNGLGVYGQASGMANNYISLTPYNVFLENYSVGGVNRRYEAARSDDVANAINYAVGQGASVINLSLGYQSGNPTQADLLMKNAMQNAWNQGTVMVTSAGNNGNTSYSIPGDFGLSVNVINLENGNYQNPGVNPRSYLSNYGPTKTISAPGSSIPSTVGNAGAAGYRLLSGTSMAAPMVSGVVALMRYANPALSVAQVHHILKVTATDTYTPGFDDQTAWGCVNAKAAVQAALDLARYGGATGVSGAGAAARQMQPGETQQLSAQTQPAASGEKLLWASSAPGVATVDSRTGLVTARAVGTASVTATTSRGYTAQYSITVKIPPPPDIGWRLQGSSWYYLDGKGAPKTGWQQVYGSWYYLGGDGVMRTGWQYLDGAWYFFPASGAMATGWLQDGANWYFMGNDGKMRTGWAWNNGSWYYLEGSGVMRTGWMQDGGGWYFLQPGGAMQTGWMLDGANWYFMGGDGAMRTGWAWDNGNWYYLEGSGVMRTGWMQDGGGWYYLQPSGQMATGWLWDGASWYYMSKSGVLQTGWLWDGGNWYYTNAQGAMQTGWLWENGVWYYLQPSGAMATGRAMADGAWHSFAANGVWRGAA